MTRHRLPWQAQCAVDNVTAILPFQSTLRSLKDRVLGFKREVSRERWTIRDGLQALQWLGPCEGLAVLEIGSGWQPLIPILFSLAGARVYMTDNHRLIRLETLRSALNAIRDHSAEISAALGIEADTILHITRDCDNWEARLIELNLTYLAPTNCEHLPLDSHSIDIVYSRAVLEHVPPATLRAILNESRRILKSQGRMWHLVDPSDHWSHRDPRITAVNMLRYPDWLFALTCVHPQNYQNRLRHSEYRGLFEETGFHLVREDRSINELSLRALSTMKVDRRFHEFSPDDLATVNSIFLAELA